MPAAKAPPKRESVLEVLADDLVGWLDKASDGVPRRVLLWLDPEGQFRPLARYLEPSLAACGAALLRADEGTYRSQVALKLELARREALANEKIVVYLPGRRREALQPKDGEPPALWGEGERWEPGALPEPPRLADPPRSPARRSTDRPRAERERLGFPPGPLRQTAARDGSGRLAATVASSPCGGSAPRLIPLTPAAPPSGRRRRTRPGPAE